MSEYIEIETEPDDAPDVMHFTTNVTLSETGEERYDSPEAMEEGSPFAQALALVDGVRSLHLAGHTMAVTRDPEMPWHIIVAEVSAAIKDFFL